MRANLDVLRGDNFVETIGLVIFVLILAIFHLCSIDLTEVRMNRSWRFIAIGHVICTGTFLLSRKFSKYKARYWQISKPVRDRFHGGIAVVLSSTLLDDELFDSSDLSWSHVTTYHSLRSLSFC